MYTTLLLFAANVIYIITVEELLASYDDQLFIRQVMIIIVYIIYYRLVS